MHLLDVYSLYDIEPVHGAGSYVYTADGTQYLDLYGGHAVISIGHAHPKYVKAIADQVAGLGFYSNSVVNGLQAEFARRLGKASGYDDYSLFLCNSGAEANENAIKLASFTTGRRKLLAFEGAFHGRTSGAVAATDNPAIRAPFNTTDAVEFVPLNDFEAVKSKLDSKQFAAVIIEGMQGVAGIRPVSDSFLRDVRDLCTKTGTLLILDEIQSGYGRTGRFFAHQYAGVKPDIITAAKGIANGFPMGAVLVSPDIPVAKGMLGTTFGGNHLACAAAIAVLDVFEDEKLVENAFDTGEYLLRQLREIAKSSPLIRDVRGRGMMIGIELSVPAAPVRKALLFEDHIFTGGAGQNIIRLLPALNLTKSRADDFLTAFKSRLSRISPNNDK